MCFLSLRILTQQSNRSTPRECIQPYTPPLSLHTLLFSKYACLFFCITYSCYLFICSSSVFFFIFFLLFSFFLLFLLVLPFLLVQIYHCRCECVKQPCKCVDVCMAVVGSISTEDVNIFFLMFCSLRTLLLHTTHSRHPFLCIFLLSPLRTY